MSSCVDCMMGRRSNQLKFKSIPILICSVLLFGSYLNYFYGSHTSNLNQAIYSEKNILQRNVIIKPKRIVLWTSYFKSSDWFNQTRFNLNSGDANCSISRYLFTTDRSVVHEAEAVIFHAADFNIKDIPVVRFPHQVYVWYTLDAPGTYRLKRKPSIKGLLEDNSEGSRGFFNWTFTYHSSSDVITSYGYTINNTDKKQLPASFDIPFVNKLMVAMVMPTCRTDSGREQLLANLRNYMVVDSFGNCSRGEKRCAEDCFDYLAYRYIFHLSFEDNLCEDYITDMVWEPLRAGLIPIVYGSGNYSKRLPRNSFIDARQYSPESLAVFLNRLSSSPSEIDAYHAWRSTQAVETRPDWCPLGQKLISATRPASDTRTEKSLEDIPSTANLLKWWIDVNKCLSEYPLEPNKSAIESGMESVIKLLTEGVGTFNFNF